MRAYLTEGELISDHAMLERLAVEVGLRATRCASVLAGDRYADAVREDERTPPGSASTPCRSSWSTARSAPRARSRPTCLLELLRQARAANPPAAVAAGETCAADGSGC